MESRIKPCASSACLCSPFCHFRRPARRLSCAWCRLRGRRSPTNRGSLALRSTSSRLALGRIGVKTSTTIVDAAQFTTSLLSGQFDGSAAAWKDAEREQTLLFSQPYLENRLMLVARRGGDVSAATLADLKGKRIAIVEGYSYGEAIDRSGAGVRAVAYRGGQPRSSSSTARWTTR